MTLAALFMYFCSTARQLFVFYPTCSQNLLVGKEDRDANLAMGAYCEKVTGRNRAALNYYSRALELGSYEAGIAGLKLEHTAYGYCDIFNKSIKMQDLFKHDTRKQQEILCQLGSESFWRKNAIGAIYYWHAAATLDPYARELRVQRDLYGSFIITDTFCLPWKDHKSWLRPNKKINIYRSMSLEANYALKRVSRCCNLDMKKPEQQKTVKLLHLAVKLCSNFYRIDQDKIFPSKASKIASMSAPRRSGIPRFVGVPAAAAGAGLGVVSRKSKSPPASRLRQPGFGLRQPGAGLSASPVIEDTPRLSRRELRRKMRQPRKLLTSPEWGLMSVSVLDSPTSPKRNILVPESTLTSGSLAIPVEEAYNDVVHTYEVQRVLEETRRNADQTLRRTEAEERREVERQLVEAQTFRRQFITAGIDRKMLALEREEPPVGFYDNSYEEEDWNRSPAGYYDLDPELKSQFVSTPQQGRYGSMADWNFPSTVLRRRSSSPKRTYISPITYIAKYVKVHGTHAVLLLLAIGLQVHHGTSGTGSPAGFQLAPATFALSTYRQLLSELGEYFTIHHSPFTTRLPPVTLLVFGYQLAVNGRWFTPSPGLALLSWLISSHRSRAHWTYQPAGLLRRCYRATPGLVLYFRRTVSLTARGRSRLGLREIQPTPESEGLAVFSAPLYSLASHPSSSSYVSAIDASRPMWHLSRASRRTRPSLSSVARG
uniref:Uncharacterized protein n=1 Tax=Timema tahoe TaxID=61484 RepID=A0A7R9NZ56_9NEOP|nr:unnamed protein product [Timema tahoe]